MKLSELSSAELQQRLRTAGLRVRTGPFTAAIRSKLPEIAAGLRQLYADFPVDDSPLADFHLRIGPAAGLRHRLRGRQIVDVGGYFQFQPFPRAMVLPYLEWGQNWCVTNHTQQYLMLHAATLERHGRALLIVGPSGAGKSTFCAGLALAGWRLLSDELALIAIDDLRLAALARPISLKNDSIDLIQARAPQAEFGPRCEGQRKGVMAHLRPLPEWVRRMDEPAVPGMIVVVHYAAGAAPQLTPLPPARAMMYLAQCAFNYTTLGRTGFETLADLLDAAPCFQFTYGSLDEGVALIEREFTSAAMTSC